MRSLHMEQLLHRGTHRAEPMEIHSGNAAQSPGLCPCLLWFRKWRAGRASSEKKTVPIASVPLLIAALFVFWGWNTDLPWLLTAFGYKRRKALYWEVQAVSVCPVTDTSSLGNAD